MTAFLASFPVVVGSAAGGVRTFEGRAPYFSRVIKPKGGKNGGGGRQGE